jgi:hypothetical protein
MLTISIGQEVAAQQNVKYTVRSLLDPEIKATGLLGGKPKSAKPQIHPNTSFDEMASGVNTQKLISQISSAPKIFQSC